MDGVRGDEFTPQPPCPPAEIVDETRDPPLDIRFALALNGGVSLAVWIGGVVNEMLRLCNRVGSYGALCEDLNLNVEADVMTGASAGGLNAVFLALGLVHCRTDLSVLRDIWIDAGDFDALLRDPTASSSPSLMDGDGYFLARLREGIRQLMSDHPRHDRSIDVQLTVTSMTGDQQERPDDFVGVIRERRHDALIEFKSESDGTNTRFDFDDTAPNVERLARACRSTASFPGAFEPSFVTAFEPDRVPPDEPAPFVIGREINGVGGSRFLVDGGVLVNLPVRPAVEAIFDQPATGEVRRILAMVVPDPARSAVAEDDLRDAPPALLPVVSASASGIPGTQSVRGFLDDVRSQNESVAIVRRQRLALLSSESPNPKSMRDLMASATALFGSYRAGRLEAGRSQAKEELIRLCEKQGFRADAARIRRWFGDIDRWFVSVDAAPWIPSDMSSANWGASPIIRSVGRLIHLVNVLQTGTSADWIARRATIKRDLHRVRRRVTAMTDNTDAAILTPPLDPDATDPFAVINTKIQSWMLEYRDDLERELVNLGTIAEDIAALADASDNSPWRFPTMDDDLRGLSFVLALEVIEGAFGEFEGYRDQMVEIAQFDAAAPAPIDEGRTADQKVAGRQLGHFGAFLKRSWRANDWMWGRIDAATALCRVLVVEGKGDDPASGREAAQWARALQTEILAEELPVVAEAARTDLKWGASPTSRSAMFVSEYDAFVKNGGVAAAIAREPVPTRGLADEWTFRSRVALSRQEAADRALAALLKRQRIGEERWDDELGSDLLSRVVIKAVATTTSVVRTSVPSFARAIFAVIRAVALLAWGFTRTAMARGKALSALVAMVLGLAVAAIALDLGGGVDLGVFALPAWIVFLTAVVLAFLRAPFVIVPALIIGSLPGILRSLGERPKWLPQEFAWPALDTSWRWLAVVSFVAAGIVIGSWRVPVWFTRSRDRVRERLSSLDAVLGQPDE